MTCCQSLDLAIRRGVTFSHVLMWAAEPVIFRAITALAAAPSATLTVPGHGLPDGWYAAVVSAPSLPGLLARSEPPAPDDYRPVRVIDADTVEFNGINSAGWKYKGGGYLRAYTPVPLAGCTAELVVLDRLGGTVLLTLTSDPDDGIVLDDDAKTITLALSADAAAALTWKRGVYELLITSASGVTTRIAAGAVEVLP